MASVESGLGMTSVESGKLVRFALEFPLPEARVLKLTIFLVFLVFAIVAVFTISAAADEGHHHEMAAGDFGTVHFATSCSAAAQARFERAVAMLHSFGYEAARKAFEDVARQDPNCAMAWW